MNRRRLLTALAMGTTAAATARRVRGAGDRIGLALVGAGNRGLEVARAMQATGRFDVVATCDVWDERRARARKELGLEARPVFETARIEEVVGRPEVDAVLVATPDHQHLDHALVVLGARKHLYVEKPTIHALAEGPRLAAAVRASGRVCQTGTQQRSAAHYRRAKQEVVAAGRLGKIVFVRATWADFPRQRRKFDPAPLPAGLDWGRWLGRTAKVPYHPMRYETWRYYPEYGGGLLADIFTHWADVAQWMTDDARPVSAVASGGIYALDDGRKNPDTVNAVVQYRGWNLSFESTVLPVKMRASVLLEGTEGSLELARDGYTFTPHSGPPEVVKATENLDQAHALAFANAVRGDAAPTADVACGLEACRPVQLALAAYWKRRRTTFSPDFARVLVDGATSG